MENTKRPVRVAVAGTGWRAEFFLRICQALPDRFSLCGIMFHSEEGRLRALKWNAPLVSSLSALLDLKPDYAVLSLSGSAMFEALEACAARGVPALCETFTSKTEEEMNREYDLLKNARIQFAEQYQFQPLNYARLAVVNGGALGRVYLARMSIPTHHHPASLVRMVLNAGDRLPVISARAYEHKVLKGPGRGGDPAGEEEFCARHELVIYDYGDMQAFNEFESNQHRSFMRSNDFLIRGSRGEIANERVVYMKDALTPIEFDLKRVVAGAGVDLQGLFLRGVSGGQEGWLYRNDFMPARLYDDELAVASCMQKMAEYVETGRGFYGLSDALSDMYYALLTDRALETGKDIPAQKQSWMR